jgi:hypothetical protein
MAGFLPPESKVDSLEDLTTRGTNLGLAISLPSDEPATLANIVEVTTAGYARKAVTWGAVSTVEPIQVTNSAAITLGPVTADMPQAFYAFLTNVAAGTVGTLVYVWELTEPVAALANKPSFVPAGALVIE